MQYPKGNNVVFIHDILFHGKRKINWKLVEKYLRRYIGSKYEITAFSDEIHISGDFPNEYCGSKDTARLKGGLAKAKANAAQGIPELIESATHKRYKENLKTKHAKDAKGGWFRYDSTFALPVYGESGEIDRYNFFRVEMLVRLDEDGKKYLYDVINIKKETSTPHEI